MGLEDFNGHAKWSEMGADAPTLLDFGTMALNARE